MKQLYDATTRGPRCPIRGHDHRLHWIEESDPPVGHVTYWECPGGNYRFIQVGDTIDKGFLSPLMRINRPHWGWPK